MKISECVGLDTASSASLMRLLLPNVSCLPKIQKKILKLKCNIFGTAKKLNNKYISVILSGKKLTFGSNSLISGTEDVVSSRKHSLIFNQVQLG